MAGSYGMVTATGEAFDIDIPAFSLDLPQEGGRTIN
jgi:ApaG protein